MGNKLQFGFRFLVRKAPIILFLGVLVNLVLQACEKESVNPFETRQIVIYPNPVRTLLNIRSEVAIKEIYLINGLGQTAFSSTFNALEVRIDVSNLPSAVYKVSVETEEGIYAQNVMVISVNAE
jgi:sRNA-binding regulator protein Hfq